MDAWIRISVRSKYRAALGRFQSVTTGNNRPKVDIVLRLEKEVGSTLRLSGLEVSVDLPLRPPDNICLTKIPGALPHNLVSIVCALKYFFGINETLRLNLTGQHSRTDSEPKLLLTSGLNQNASLCTAPPSTLLTEQGRANRRPIRP